MEPSGDVEVFRAGAAYTLSDLARFARASLEVAGADLAVAFGSYARGTADGYSDLDLLVVLETELPFVERWKALRAMLDALPVTVDLLVYTPDEYRRGRAGGMGVFSSIAKEGVTVYARA
jgi:predicted nucleotidyltransferase